MFDLDYHSPNQTRGLELKWTSTAGRYQSTVPLGTLRDVSAYRFLSFRAGETVHFLFLSEDNIRISGGIVTGQHSAQLGSGAIDADLRIRFADHNAALSSGASASTLVAGSRWLITDPANGQWFTVRTQYVAYPGSPWTAIVVERAGAGGGQPLDPSGASQDLYVRLTTAGGGPSRAVRAGYFGAIPAPYRPHQTEASYYEWFNDDNTMAILSTIRIPLSAWTIKALTAPIVELTNVESVTFEMSLTATGDVLIDDIEFTQ